MGAKAGGVDTSRDTTSYANEQRAAAASALIYGRYSNGSLLLIMLTIATARKSKKTKSFFQKCK